MNTLCNFPYIFVQRSYQKFASLCELQLDGGFLSRIRRERQRMIRQRNYLSSGMVNVHTANRKRITNTWIRRPRDPWHWSRNTSGTTFVHWFISLFPSYFLPPFTNTRKRDRRVILYSMFSPLEPEGSLEWKGEGTKPGCDSRNRWEKTRWIWWWLQRSVIGSLGRCVRFPKIELRGG